MSDTLFATTNDGTPTERASPRQLRVLLPPLTVSPPTGMCLRVAPEPSRLRLP